MIWIQMGVLIRIHSMTVAEHILCDGNTCHSIEMSCRSMSEKMRMEVFVDTYTVRSTSKDILQCARRDASASF